MPATNETIVYCETTDAVTVKNEVLREMCTSLHYQAKVITLSGKRSLLHYRTKIITLSDSKFITLSGDDIILSGGDYIIGRFDYIIGQLLH